MSDMKILWYAYRSRLGQIVLIYDFDVAVFVGVITLDMVVLYMLFSLQFIWMKSRGVAQSGSVSEWGSEGRRFKSSRPDQ